MDIDENAPGNSSQQVVTRTTDNEAGRDSWRGEPELPLPPDDESPVDEDMSDVAATNSVSTEHPEPGSESRSIDSAEPPESISQDGDVKAPRGMPASDPESGA